MIGVKLVIVGVMALMCNPAIAQTPKLVSGHSKLDVAEWKTWAPRDEIAPRFSTEKLGGADSEALKIEGNGDRACFGRWQHTVEGISGGRTYKLSAKYLVRDVAFPQRSVSARVTWLNAKGEQERPPDYALETGREGQWTRIEHVTLVPQNATKALIELNFGWSPKGAVWWDDIKLAEESSPRLRVVRAVTIYDRPSGTGSAAKSVEEFCNLVLSAASKKPDIVCLPEGITAIGTGKSYVDVSESVPGPTTKTLGAVASKLGCYIVAGLYERVGHTVYNTAVLIGRHGELVGSYRKTHLPREEVDGGLTPGDSYPVFKTDFGTVGLMVCWDVQFPEPARSMAAKGAEVILLPIAGGSEILARARAIENHIFLVTSSYDMKTFIVDPTGEVLAEATRKKPVALAELHLDRNYIQYWVGDMKPRTWKERRVDLKVD